MFFACNLSIVFNNLFLVILMKMEWTEDHDIQLAKEVLVSEPYRSRKNCEAFENFGNT